MPLLTQHLNLRFRQAREAKHANLIRDVPPRPRRPLTLKPLTQAGAHLRNPAAHRPQIVLPLRKQ